MEYNFTHNSKKIILRKSPLFEIILAENYFEIINSDNKNNKCFFEKTSSIKLKKERIIWYLTIINFLLSLSSGVNFETVRQENEMKIFYEGIPIRYNLKNCDLVKASIVIEEIKSKLKKATHTTG